VVCKPFDDADAASEDAIFFKMASAMPCQTDIFFVADAACWATVQFNSPTWCGCVGVRGDLSSVSKVSLKTGAHFMFLEKVIFITTHTSLCFFFLPLCSFLLQNGATALLLH